MARRGIQPLKHRIIMADTEVDDLPENATPAMRRAARIALSLSDAQLNALPESQRAVLLRFRAMQAQRKAKGGGAGEGAGAGGVIELPSGADADLPPALQRERARLRREYVKKRAKRLVLRPGTKLKIKALTYLTVGLVLVGLGLLLADWWRRGGDAGGDGRMSEALRQQRRWGGRAAVAMVLLSLLVGYRCLGSGRGRGSVCPCACSIISMSSRRVSLRKICNKTQSPFVRVAATPEPRSGALQQYE